MEKIINRYLLDIKTCIDSIESYLGANRNFFVYRENKMLRRADEREFEIIGEAINKLDKLNPELPITSKEQIIGLRNRVIHGYDKIDDEIVWGVIVRHLPKLKVEIEELLK